ncbi:MAG TPA: ABC transporter permease [Candidatus Polarisedimenticolia bacterium]|nr:ABC transporter permease [Candidatus Polarisedimenticolia bacterium]
MLPLLEPGRIGNEALRTVLLVARREFLTRVRSRFFVIGTIAFMALLAGYIVLQALVFSRATTTVKVGFVGQAQVLAQPLTTAAGTEDVKVVRKDPADISTGEDQVRNGSLDALISGDPASPQVEVKDDLNPTLAATLNAIVKQVALNRALTAEGANAAAVQTAVANASIQLVFLDPNAALKAQRTVVGIFVAALLYTALVVYGQIVAAGVVEEKANRIIEILLGTVRPRQLLLGKVLGIGMVGFLQLALLGATALVAVGRTHAISIPNVGATAIAGGLMWFVLGFILYANIYAAAGSLVSRQEDLPSVTTPLTMLVVGTYLAFFWVEANPTNAIGVALSIIPPLSPILMPARMATGDAQAWQVILAVILAIGEIALLNALAARIYANSVMRIGTRVKLRQAWRGTD